MTYMQWRNDRHMWHRSLRRDKFGDESDETDASCMPMALLALSPSIGPLHLDCNTMITWGFTIDILQTHR